MKGLERVFFKSLQWSSVHPPVHLPLAPASSCFSTPSSLLVHPLVHPLGPSSWSIYRPIHRSILWSIIISKLEYIASFSSSLKPRTTILSWISLVTTLFSLSVRFSRLHNSPRHPSFIFHLSREITPYPPSHRSQTHHPDIPQIPISILLSQQAHIQRHLSQTIPSFHGHRPIAPHPLVTRSLLLFAIQIRDPVSVTEIPVKHPLSPSKTPHL